MNPAGRHPWAMITVRVSSARLPRKCLLEFGGVNVLEHVIERTKWGGFAPLVCTTENADDDVIERIAKNRDCALFRGSEKDKLHRWMMACDTYGVDAFHTVDADDPFFDPELGQLSLALLKEEKLDLVYPSSNTYLASVGYSLTAEVVRKACDIKTTDDTEMMWYHVEKVPGLKATELRVTNARIRDVRLTLDYQEDYWLLRTVLRILGPHAQRADIENLFSKNPDLTKINWFRNSEWKQVQESKRV